MQMYGVGCEERIGQTGWDIYGDKNQETLFPAVLLSVSQLLCGEGVYRSILVGHKVWLSVPLRSLLTSGLGSGRKKQRHLIFATKHAFQQQQ